MEINGILKDLSTEGLRSTDRMSNGAAATNGQYRCMVDRPWPMATPNSGWDSNAMQQQMQSFEKMMEQLMQTMLTMFKQMIEALAQAGAGTKKKSAAVDEANSGATASSSAADSISAETSETAETDDTAEPKAKTTESGSAASGSTASEAKKTEAEKPFSFSQFFKDIGKSLDDLVKGVSEMGKIKKQIKKIFDGLKSVFKGVGSAVLDFLPVGKLGTIGKIGKKILGF